MINVDGCALGLGLGLKGVETARQELTRQCDNVQECPDIREFDNGDLEGKCAHATPGKQCTFVCDDGYSLDGDETITCQKNGKWNKKMPYCKAKGPCRDIEEFENGRLEGKCVHAKPENKCTFLCNKGYSLVGEQTITCQKNGKWDEKSPYCKANVALCPDIEEFENGRLEGKCVNAKPENKCTFLCDKGYSLVGEETITCQKNGKWDEKKPHCNKANGGTHDCAAIKMQKSDAPSGKYEIRPKNMNQSIFVQCDMTTDNGGWTIFQKRGDFGGKSDYFYRGWNDYVKGFGERENDKEYWIGLDAIHAISSFEPQSLRIDMEDFDSIRKYAKYTYFSVGGPGDYRLGVNGYSGSAGDSMLAHNNMPFSTLDNDHTGLYTCTSLYKGAWWYNACHHANLNGLYLRGHHTDLGIGINWFYYRWDGWYYSLKSTEMKMRPSKYS